MITSCDPNRCWQLTGIGLVQNEGFAMRSIPGSSPTADSEARLPGVFFACPLHDKPATYCSCKREEGEDANGA